MIYVFFSLFLFLCVCVCFCVSFCLYSFAFTISPRVLCVLFYYLKIFFLNKVIKIKNNYFILLYFILPSSFFLFFLPFILSHVDDRLLVLQPGIRAVPLRWESQVQDTGPQETSQLHVISNGKRSPRDLHLYAKTQLHSTTSKLQYWTPYAKQLARQEHNPIR